MTEAAAAAQLRTLRVVVGDRPGLGRDLVLSRRFGSRVVRWSGGDGTWPGGDTWGSGLAPATEVDWLHLTVQSTAWLRRCIARADRRFLARRVTLVIRSWSRPMAGWTGRLGYLPGLVGTQLDLPASKGRAVIDLALAEPVPVGAIVAAALGALVPQRRLPSALTPEIGVDAAVPAWLNPNLLGASWQAGDASDGGRAGSHDVQLVGGQPLLGPPAEVDVLRVGDHGISSEQTGQAVLVDTGTCNPVGRSRTTISTTARLRIETDAGRSRWGLDGDDGALAGGWLDRLPLNDDQLHAVRSVDIISCEVAGDCPAGEAALIVQLASTGALLQVDRLPEAVAALLSPELARELQAALPDELSDSIEWEIRGVRQRRAALRGHSAGLRLPALVSRTFSGWRGPTVSVLLVTMRPGSVPDAVASIARQTYPQMEILVGLHGCQLGEDARRSVLSCGRPVELIEVPGTATFGEALGVVTSRARGDLVTKMDDDDVYGPEHVWDLVLAREFSHAVLVGKGAEFVHLEELGVTVRRISMNRENYTTVVAGGTILISRGDLEAVGGWRPVPRGVDQSLLGRVLRDGGLVYRTHPMGFIYRRHSRGHTWDTGLGYFLRNSGPQWNGLPDYDEFTTAG